MSHPPIPPILASVIACIAAAVPARGRATFLDLLLGAAATKSGHVTDAILASGLARGWSTYYWFLEQGRWSWLRVWAALLEVLTMLFRPAVWYVVIDDSVVERVSTEAPGSLMHHNHTDRPGGQDAEPWCAVAVRSAPTPSWPSAAGCAYARRCSPRVADAAPSG